MTTKTKKQKKCITDLEMVPPDGKYGWVIVISYAIANFIGIPTTSNFGLIFKDKFDAMKMPAADLTLIININSALSMSLGLINGPLLRYFGYRKISVVAAVLFSVGLMLTALTDSVLGLIISYGVITAVGYGLSNSSFGLALNSFFTTKLNKASGVAMTLAGIGPIVYPPLINFLLHLYGVSGCMLIIGAIALHMLVAAVLLQPLKWHLVRDTSYELPLKEPLNFPAILPNVSTFLSIGKYSESSFVPNSGPRLPFASITDLGFDQKSTHFELSHDIDTQSIYGFDQIIHRQPSSNKLDQAVIARNFSKRNLVPIPQGEELGLINHTVDDKILNLLNVDEVDNEPQIQIGKPLRWFESGSVGSVHLGSSLEIFKEPPITTAPSNDRRKSSIFTPWRKQSTNLINALRMTSRRASHLFVPTDETIKQIKKERSLPEKMNVMHEDDEFNVPTEMPAEEEKDDGCCCSVFKWFVRFFDLDLLRDNIYLNIMIGMAISIFAEINFAILTPFILSDLKFNSDEIAYILFVMAIADLISRFCSPFIADKLNLSIRVSYLISLILLVLTRMSMILTTNYVNMLIICSALGVAKGIRSVYMSIVIPSYIPLERLASASAIQLFANGIVMMCIGPVLGLIKDITGSYVGCIFFLNACTLITISMYSIELTYTWYRQKSCSEQTSS